MVKSFFYLILFSIISTSSVCQTVSGIVLDFTKNTPIALVHIYDRQSGFGTTSNSDGEFEISLPKSNADTDLTFSHIGYKTISIAIKKDTVITLFMQSDITSLDEAVVYGSVREIASKVKEKLKRNAEKMKYGRAFYRQITKKDTLPVEWIESFVDVAYDITGLKKLNVKQARVAARRILKPTDMYIPSKNHIYSSFFQLYREVNNPGNVAIPFSENQFDDYSFYLEKRYLKGQDTLVSVSFSAESTIEAAIAPQGNFTYNLSKDILVEVSIQIEQVGMRMYNVPKDFPIKIRTDNASTEVHFSYSLDKKNELEVIYSSMNFDFFLDEVLYPSNVESRLIFYETLRKKPKKLIQPDNRTNFLEKFYNSKYRPKFWKHNPVIKLTKEEEGIINSFEKENAFGTYFKGKK